MAEPMTRAPTDGDAGRAAPRAPGARAWADGWFWSGDSLRLHYRDWRPDTASERPALLCLPGLTRTAADFEALATRLPDWRLVAPDLRGRGESAWAKDSLSYMPLTYMHDLRLLIEAAKLTRFVAIGTSVGGQLALQLATSHRDRLAGIVLNDIGPEIAPAGLGRLRANVGRGGNWPTWLHAARDLRARNHDVYPDWSLPDWLAFAKRLCRLSPSGRINFDYDPRIAEPFRLPGRDAGTDLWGTLGGLAGLPVLSLRGSRSDVLTPAIVARMAALVPGMVCVEVPNVGNAPTLAEPQAIAALDNFLAFDPTGRRQPATVDQATDIITRGDTR